MDAIAALTKRGDDAVRELRPGSGLEMFDADCALLHVLLTRLESTDRTGQASITASIIGSTSTVATSPPPSSAWSSSPGGGAAASTPQPTHVARNYSMIPNKNNRQHQQEKEQQQKQQQQPQRGADLYQLGSAEMVESTLLPRDDEENHPETAADATIGSKPQESAKVNETKKVDGNDYKGAADDGVEEDDFLLHHHTLLQRLMIARDSSGHSNLTVPSIGAAPPVSHILAAAAAADGDGATSGRRNKKSDNSPVGVDAFPIDVRRQVGRLRSEYEIGRAALHRMMNAVRDLIAEYHTARSKNQDLERQVQSLKKNNETIAKELRQVKLSTKYLGGGGAGAAGISASSPSPSLSSSPEFDEAWKLESEVASQQLDDQVTGTVENFKTLVLLHRHSRDIASIVCPDEKSPSSSTTHAPVAPAGSGGGVGEEFPAHHHDNEGGGNMLDKYPTLRRSTRRELVQAIRNIDDRNEAARARAQQRDKHHEQPPPPRRRRIGDVLRAVDDFLTAWGGAQGAAAATDSFAARTRRDRKAGGGGADDKSALFAISTVKSEAHTMQIDNATERIEGITILRKTGQRRHQKQHDEQQQQQQRKRHGLGGAAAAGTSMLSPSDARGEQQQQQPTSASSIGSSSRTFVKCRPQDRRVISLATMLVEALCHNKSPFIVVRSVVPDETILSRATMRSHGLGPVWQTGGHASFCVASCPLPPLLLRKPATTDARSKKSSSGGGGVSPGDAAKAPGIVTFLCAFAVPPHVTDRFQTAAAKAEAGREFMIKANHLRCYASSALPGCVTSALVGPYVDPARPFFITANESGGEYVEIFFTRAVVCPTGYGFASCHVSGAASFPRSWRLEASTDAGITWKLLKRHVDDRTLHHGCPRAVWALDPHQSSSSSSADDDDKNKDGVYSRFRIAIEGPNSSGTWHINASCIEIYGRVLTLQSAAVPLIARELVPFVGGGSSSGAEQSNAAVASGRSHETTQQQQQQYQQDASSVSVQSPPSTTFTTPYTGLGAAPVAYVAKEKKTTTKRKRTTSTSPSRKR